MRELNDGLHPLYCALCLFPINTHLLWFDVSFSCFVVSCISCQYVNGPCGCYITVLQHYFLKQDAWVLTSSVLEFVGGKKFDWWSILGRWQSRAETRPHSSYDRGEYWSYLDTVAEARTHTHTGMRSYRQACTQSHRHSQTNISIATHTHVFAVTARHLRTLSWSLDSFAHVLCNIVCSPFRSCAHCSRLNHLGWDRCMHVCVCVCVYGSCTIFIASYSIWRL